MGDIEVGGLTITIPGYLDDSTSSEALGLPQGTPAFTFPIRDEFLRNVSFVSNLKTESVWDFTLLVILEIDANFNLIIEAIRPTVGWNYLWGSSLGPGEHSTVFSANPGLNGPLGPGWYLHFIWGSPRDMTIRVDLIPPNRSVLLAMKYPPGTTFTLQYKSWSSCTYCIYLIFSSLFSFY